uniref:Uncharacterized protein n=1 Tax=Noccaea caerulescens TaxID=107243 RepID=A0A1J3FPX1_NOCCA
MKKASSRSQRGNKGIKGKHILQICVLLGVCIWLIYQVKYSHDKKKEFYEKDGEKSTVLSAESKDGLVKLGRKDLLPGYHNQNEKEKHVEEDEDEEEKESKSKVENGKHEEEEKEEEEEAVEDDEEEKNKQGEEVPEEDEEENKHGEDDIDEQDQSKNGGDNDKDDELFDEEKEGGSSERDEKEKDTVDEAREEHYKADDASSAVSHDSRVLKTEKLKESLGNSTETAQENNANATTSEVEVQKEPDLKLGEAESGNVVEKATKEVKDGDSEPSISETKSAVTESTGETVHGNSTEAILEASGFLKNETEIMRERSQEDGAPPSGSSDLHTVSKVEQTLNGSDPNMTVTANITNKDSIQDEFKNSTSESSLTENISGSNITEVSTENSRSDGDDEIGEKESSNLFSAEQMEDTDDTPETTILQEEREALTDPQTLPDIRIEGNEEDEEEAMAAE